jgi:mannosyl-3-phosphoglycerate phosphatase
MLAPRQVIFTAVDRLFLHASARSLDEAGESLHRLSRLGIPLILATAGTRAQIEPLRRRLQHAHPFLTEGGAGLFIPDGYFNLHLEGANRCGRNFCVPFARSAAEASAALPDIAEDAGASAIGFSQMSLREVSNNTGLAPREAELFRQREFGEVFFLAGETPRIRERFLRAAKEKGWEAVPGDPLWVLRAPLKTNGENAVRYLMNIYRKALHGRQRSVGIGSEAGDLYFLAATDVSILLPRAGGEFDAQAESRLPRAGHAAHGGLAGWNEAVIRMLDRT